MAPLPGRCAPLARRNRLRNVEDARTHARRCVAFYKRALDRVDGRWAGTGETGLRFLDEHHLYAQDLDLFGDGSLFQLLSCARTGIGERTLAGWLLEPAQPENDSSTATSRC